MASGYTNYDGVFLAKSQAPAKTLWANALGPLVGTGGAEQLVGGGYGLGIAGASGDDTFVLNKSNDYVTTGGGGGVDTVVAAFDYILPSYIQNLTLNGSWGRHVGIGNSGANIITADASGEVLFGAGGDDVLVAAGGGDIFAFQAGSGKDVIVGFHTGSTSADMVRLWGYGFTSLAQVQAAMTQSGTDVILKLDATDLIDFKNTTISAFTAANFQLKVDTASMTPTFDDEFNSFNWWNPATKSGVWKTTYQNGAQKTLDSHTILPSLELSIDVDPSFKGTGSTPLGLNPFSINNGVLTISAQPTPAADKALLWNYAYTTGVITTEKTFSQTYGYFEMRAQLPSSSKGLWPEFWMLPVDGSDSTELDVFESPGLTPNTLYQTIHWHAADGSAQYISFPTYIPDLLGGFHTFGVLWTPSTLTWTVDGNAVGSAPTPAAMNKPMYMITNLSVGGNWPGAPTSATHFPANFQIDYIRAYSQTPSVTHINGGAGNDTYYVHNSNTTITVAPGTPNESVIADVSFILPANIQNITVAGSGLMATGNAMSNHLTSTGGSNNLVGGLGNDTYYVHSAYDHVYEAVGQGNDAIISTVSFTAPANVEVLTLVGSGLTATANAAGHTRLVSQNGGNTLVGSTAGNDVFVLWHSNDVVVAQAGAPNETVVTGISYTLPANVQNLIGTGNIAQTLVGNGLDNTITAGKGPYTLTGGGGNDTFVFAPGDKVDTITDFKAGGASDRIDVSAYITAGLTPSFVDHTGYVAVTFSNGEAIDVMNLHASNVHLSGNYIL